MNDARRRAAEAQDVQGRLIAAQQHQEVEINNERLAQAHQLRQATEVMQQLKEQNRDNAEAMRKQRELIELQARNLREAEERLRAMSSHGSSQRSQPLRGTPPEKTATRSSPQYSSLTPGARSPSPLGRGPEQGWPETIPEGAVLRIAGRDYHLSPVSASKQDAEEW